MASIPATGDVSKTAKQQAKNDLVRYCYERAHENHCLGSNDQVAPLRGVGEGDCVHLPGRGFLCVSWV